MGRYTFFLQLFKEELRQSQPGTSGALNREANRIRTWIKHTIFPCNIIFKFEHIISVFTYIDILRFTSK